jgi:hypothetical protein
VGTWTWFDGGVEYKDEKRGEAILHQVAVVQPAAEGSEPACAWVII